MIKDFGNSKEYFGKFLFIISIVAFFALIFSPLTNVLFFVDEYYTLGLIKHPLMQGITITANDVHPPLYYILLKVCVTIFSMFNIIFISKIVTIIPYLIILLFAGTKIKTEYNWLTAGLFTFTLFSMSNFFITYLTIRMYSWAMLFLVLSFIYLKDVLTHSDLKSWVLFTLFTLLGAYTHYYCAISSVVLYFLLLIYFYLDDNFTKGDIKKWFASVFVLIIGYLPWTYILLNQVRNVTQGFWIPPIDFNAFLNLLSFYANSTSEILMIISVIFIIVLLIIAIINIKQENNTENNYILMGMLVFVFSLILGVIISLLSKPILVERYLLPACAVFWLATSILIGKLKNNRLFLILFVIIILIGIAGISGIISSTQSDYQIGVQNQVMLDEINNANCTILCTSPGEVIQFGTYLNESKVFTNCESSYGISYNDSDKLFHIKYNKNLNKIIDKYNNSNIYLIKGNWEVSDLVNNNTEQYYSIGANQFYKL